MEGMFEPKLDGPFEFVQYKDVDGYAALLKDGNDNMFDCAVPHLVKYSPNVVSGI